MGLLAQKAHFDLIYATEGRWGRGQAVRLAGGDYRTPLVVAKVQRKVCNAVAQLAAAGSSLDRPESRQLLRLINIRARHPGTRRAAFPQRHSSKANNLCARIRIDPPKSLRPFKGIICADVSEFESHMPSHAVRSPPACHRVVKRVRYLQHPSNLFTGSHCGAGFLLWCNEVTTDGGRNG